MVMRNTASFLLVVVTVLCAWSLQANVLIDPTRPVTTPGPNESEVLYSQHQIWTLDSTLVSPRRRVAVINGKLVSEGESVDGARVLKISRHSVLVQTREKRITLKLLPDIVERNP